MVSNLYYDIPSEKEKKWRNVSLSVEVHLNESVCCEYNSVRGDVEFFVF